MIVSLFQNPVIPSRGSLLADFHVADFDGYLDSPGISFSPSYIDIDGTALALGSDVAFVATGGSKPQTIYGYILATPGRADLLAAFAFAQPVSVVRAGDGVTVVPFLRYSGD